MSEGLSISAQRDMIHENERFKEQNHHLIGLCDYFRVRCESLEDGLNKYHSIVKGIADSDGGVVDKLAAFLGGINIDVSEGGNEAVQPQERPGGEGTSPEKATGQTTH